MCSCKLAACPGMLRVWSSPGPRLECVPRAGAARGGGAGCVVCVSLGCARGARGPRNKLSWRRPVASPVGPGLRLGSEGWGPGGRRLRHVGLFVVSQVQRGVGWWRIRDGAGSAGRRGPGPEGPARGGGSRGGLRGAPGPAGGEGRAAGRSCGDRAAAAPRRRGGVGVRPGGPGLALGGRTAPPPVARWRRRGRRGLLGHPPPPSTPQLCTASGLVGCECTRVSVCLGASRCRVTALSLSVCFGEWSLLEVCCVCVCVCEVVRVIAFLNVCIQSCGCVSVCAVDRVSAAAVCVHVSVPASPTPHPTRRPGMPHWGPSPAELLLMALLWRGWPVPSRRPQHPRALWLGGSSLVPGAPE